MHPFPATTPAADAIAVTPQNLVQEAAALDSVVRACVGEEFRFELVGALIRARTPLLETDSSWALQHLAQGLATCLAGLEENGRGLAHALSQAGQHYAAVESDVARALNEASR